MSKLNIYLFVMSYVADFNDNIYVELCYARITLCYFNIT
jgi:hypothetical protein